MPRRGEEKGYQAGCPANLCLWLAGDLRQTMCYVCLLSACPASYRLCVPRPVPTAWMSLSAHLQSTQTPQRCPSLPWGLVPLLPALPLTFPSFLLAERGHFYTCRSYPIICPLPTCPSSSWPKDMVSVSCILQGALLSLHVLYCLYAMYFLFPLPGILFSATIRLANCYFSSKTQLTSSRKSSLTSP